MVRFPASGRPANPGAADRTTEHEASLPSGSIPNVESRSVQNVVKVVRIKEESPAQSLSSVQQHSDSDSSDEVFASDEDGGLGESTTDADIIRQRRMDVIDKIMLGLRTSLDGKLSLLRDDQKGKTKEVKESLKKLKIQSPPAKKKKARAVQRGLGYLFPSSRGAASQAAPAAPATLAVSAASVASAPASPYTLPPQSAAYPLLAGGVAPERRASAFAASYSRRPAAPILPQPVLPPPTAPQSRASYRRRSSDRVLVDFASSITPVTPAAPLYGAPRAPAPSPYVPIPHDQQTVDLIFGGPMPPPGAAPLPRPSPPPPPPIAPLIARPRARRNVKGLAMTRTAPVPVAVEETKEEAVEEATPEVVAEAKWEEKEDEDEDEDEEEDDDVGFSLLGADLDLDLDMDFTQHSLAEESLPQQPPVVAEEEYRPRPVSKPASLVAPRKQSSTLENDDHDGRRKKSKRVASEKENSGNGKKFACPYYKRNPKKYATWTSCPGPGWDEVHRVKTHLYRRHTLPLQCPRCWETFKTDELMRNHLQQDPPCTVQRNVAIVEGFTKDQEKKLRSRKKTHADMTDDDKWREIYAILFPDDDLSSIPSAYYENREDDEVPPLAEFEDYAKFVRREMPALVRRELETLFKDEFQDIEERLRPRVAEIVLNLQPRLLQIYRQSAADPQTSEASSESPQVQNSTDGSSTPATTSSNTYSDPSMGMPTHNFDWADWETPSSTGAGSSTTDTDGGVNWTSEFDELLNQSLFSDIPAYPGSILPQDT